MNLKNNNAILLGTGEFRFSDGARTVAEARTRGYLDFGNIAKVSLQPEIEEAKDYSSDEGFRNLARTWVTRAEVKFNLTLSELKNENLQSLFFGTPGTQLTQAAMAAVAGTAINFSVGSPSVPNRWYDILVAGAPVRNITAVTVATLVEGTDFEVEYRLGLIRFLTAQTVARTPTVTGPQITAATAPKALNILAASQRSGIGRLTIFDRDTVNRVFMEVVDFGCDVKITGNTEIDGQNASRMELIVSLTTPRGRVDVRE